jgi:hypothetical protein
MGKAVGEGSGIMRSGPSKIAEAVVAAFVPPACREEVLGDLHERYRSSGQYAIDALSTIPLVILSRIRRTADPQVLVMQAFTWYMSFLGASWLIDPGFLNQRDALLRLAIPGGMAMLGLVLEDSYAKPGPRSALNLTRAPLFSLGLALASQGIFKIGNSELAIPNWIMFYGCGMSILLSCALRMLFPPVSNQLQGAHVPADWLKRTLGRWATDRSAFPKPRIVILLLALLITYLVWRRV